MLIAIFMGKVTKFYQKCCYQKRNIRCESVYVKTNVAYGKNFVVRNDFCIK